MLWAQAQPTGEVLHCGKVAHVGAYLTQQHQRRVRVYSFEDRQILTGHPVQGAAYIEIGFVGLLGVPPLPPWSRPTLPLIRER
jgi:hypothetical protein